ncbi:MAG TPA: signal recognition particle-docking protein FtsY [Beijerinckiaceae bacterium]|jgi:fused signal recognition particle receptor
MSENETKPGFFGRLFGRKTAETTRPSEAPQPQAGEEAPAAPVPASRSEGAPDFTTAAAAHELPPVEPTVTQASPDFAPEPTLPPELAGADLQPVEGIEPEGGAPAEPIPRAEPEVAPGASAPGSLAAGPDTAAPNSEPPRTWWRRLTEGLRRTSSSLSEGVTGIFTKRRLDATVLEELEDVLVQADLGVEMATRIAEAVGRGRYDKEIAPEEVKAILAAEAEKALQPVAKPLAVDRTRKPFVILMAGVNGAGKTTTIGKLAQKFRAQGLKVTLAAGDTFRAAAIEQLKVWGQRTGARVVAREQGSDATGLAFDALQEAREDGTDVLLIDTAGRLQNKAGLMAELEKIVRVLRKVDPDAPHAVLLVLDATVGQNAVSQVELFGKAAGVTGLVMTKLDGTARGGILVALAERFKLPVHFIGVGEGVDDLEPFAARDFARAVAGLEEA